MQRRSQAPPRLSMTRLSHTLASPVCDTHSPQLDPQNLKLRFLSHTPSRHSYSLAELLPLLHLPFSSICTPSPCLETLKPPKTHNSQCKKNWNTGYTLRFMVVNWGGICLPSSLCRWVIWMRPVFTNRCAPNISFSLRCHNFKCLQIPLEGDKGLRLYGKERGFWRWQGFRVGGKGETIRKVRRVYGRRRERRGENTGKIPFGECFWKYQHYNRIFENQPKT